MANEGVIDGGDLLLYVKVGSTWTLIGEAKSHSLSNKSEVRIRRTKSSGLYPSRRIVGLDASVTTDCLVTYDGYGYFDLLTLQQSRTSVKLKLAGRTAQVAGRGDVEEAGDKYLEASFVIESLDLNAPNEDDASFTANFSIDGNESPNGLEIKTVSA